MMTRDNVKKTIPIRSINGREGKKNLSAIDNGIDSNTTQKAPFAEVYFQKKPKRKTTTTPGLMNPVYS